MTAFDEYETKSEINSPVSRNEDPEQKARDDYMKSLQKFRKDELVLQEESDDDIGASEDPSNNKEQNSVEEAYNLVESIDNRMNRINQAIRGIDKRISYNYRLIGSVVPIDYQHLFNKHGPSGEKKQGEQNLEEEVKKNLESDMQDI